MVTDPIADMLTTIRNSLEKKHEYVSIPYSRMKAEVLEVLKKKKMIEDYLVIDAEKITKKALKITLKYISGKPAITLLQRVSKPGKRVYTDYKNIPVVKNNYGFMIISTSKGIKDTFSARKEQVGGEIMCQVL